MTTTCAVRNRAGELERFEPLPLPPLHVLPMAPPALRIPHFMPSLIGAVLILAAAAVIRGLENIDWASLIAEAGR